MRYRFFRLFLLLSLAFVSGPAVALDAGDHGLNGPDWHAATPDLGGQHKWSCQSSSCGGQADVSYGLQIFTPVFTLLDYESLWKSRAKNPKGVPQAITKRGLFRRIHSYDETDGDLRHYTVILKHRETNGAIDFLAAAYMARGLQAYELRSSALTSEQAEANLKLLVEVVATKFKVP